MSYTIFKSGELGMSAISFTPHGNPLFVTERALYLYGNDGLKTLHLFHGGSKPLTFPFSMRPRLQRELHYSAPVFTNNSIVFGYTVRKGEQITTIVEGLTQGGTVVWKQEFIDVYGIAVTASANGMIFLLAVDKVQTYQVTRIGFNGDILGNTKTSFKLNTQVVLYPLNQSILLCYAMEDEICLLQVDMDGKPRTYLVHKCAVSDLAIDGLPVYFQKNALGRLFLVVDEPLDLPVYMLEIKDNDELKIKESLLRGERSKGIFTVTAAFTPAEYEEYYWLHTNEINTNENTVKSALKKFLWNGIDACQTFTVEDTPIHQLAPIGLPPVISKDGSIITLWSTAFNKRSVGIFANELWRFIHVANVFYISNFGSDLYVARNQKNGIQIEKITL